MRIYDRTLYIFPIATHREKYKDNTLPHDERTLFHLSDQIESIPSHAAGTKYGIQVTQINLNCWCDAVLGRCFSSVDFFRGTQWGTIIIWTDATHTERTVWCNIIRWVTVTKRNETEKKMKKKSKKEKRENKDKNGVNENKNTSLIRIH